MQQVNIKLDELERKALGLLCLDYSNRVKRTASVSGFAGIVMAKAIRDLVDEQSSKNKATPYMQSLIKSNQEDKR